jgi:hypothetical protein
LNNSLSFKIYAAVSALPMKWDELATANIFLSTAYLVVLEKSAPKNMTCHFIGIFENDELVGIALSQFLDLNALNDFGKRDRCFKAAVRGFVFRNFSSHVLFIGNNMLTGQNAFLVSEKINPIEAIKILRSATSELKTIFKARGKKVHITTFKDFKEKEAGYFEIPEFANNYRFSTQPNMIFTIDPEWKSEQDYIDALSKKYRDQYKRSHKKAIGIEKRKMHLEEIIAHENTIYDLYRHVAENAPFNTFFLAKDHFRIFKEKLKDNFLFYGYFLDQKLIGFNTLIKNGTTLDTYFLGYDESIQRERMLYLNMLYDMVAYAINKGYKEVVFARTALEIKSSVGAKPVAMYGFMEHERNFLNKYMDRIFNYLEPKTIWQQRHPFK